MRTVLLSDFLVLKKKLLAGLVVCLFLVVFFVVNGDGFLPAVIAGAISFGYVSLVSAFAYDEQNRWQEMRLAMPVSRTQVVLGRYLAVLLGSLAGIVVVVLAGLVLSLESQAVSAAGGDASFLMQIEPQGIVLMSAIGLAYCLLVTAVTAPFVFRFGFNGAICYLPFIFILLTVGIAVAAGKLLVAHSIGDVLNGLFLSLSPASVGLAVAGAALAVYAVSALVSVKVMEARDF